MCGLVTGNVADMALALPELLSLTSSGTFTWSLGTLLFNMLSLLPICLSVQSKMTSGSCRISAQVFS